MRKYMMIIIALTILITGLSSQAADTVIKGKIGEQDFNKYDGISDTFSRQTSTGGTATLRKVGTEVDVLMVYGSGSNYNQVAISNATQTLGSSRNVILYLRPGTWAIDSNLTIGSNFVLRVPHGTVLQVATGVTLTINGKLDAGVYQIFSGSGTVTLAKDAAPESYAQWKGAKGDGSTDDFTPLTWAANCGIPLNLVKGSSYYKTSATIEMSTADQVIFGEGSIKYVGSTTGKPVINITANGVKIRGITIRGRQYAAYAWGEHAIRVYGAEATRYSDIEIIGVEIYECGSDGIRIYHTDRYKINGNYIHDCMLGGVEDIAGKDGQINYNEICDIDADPSGDAYGIASSADETGTYVRSDTIQMIGNIIRNIPWEGLDSHGGKNITMALNQIYDCAGGIALTDSNNDAGTPIYGVDNAVIANNIIDAENISSSYGITIENSTSGGFCEGISVTGNTLKNLGDPTIQSKCGLYVRNTKGLSVTGNAFVNCSITGIMVYNNNYGFLIEGNTFTDMYANSGVNMAVYVASINNEGSIGNNSLLRGSKTAGSVNNYFLYLENYASNKITYSNNADVRPTVSWLYDLGDRLIRGTVANTSGTGEDTIGSATFWSGSIKADSVIKISFRGGNTGTGGNKTIKFYWDGNAVTLMPANNNQYNWWGEITIKQYDDSTTAKINYIFWTDAPGVLTGSTTLLAMDLTQPVEMLFTGECLDVNDRIGLGYLNIER